jgi:UDP-N-acetyl-D-glucosamine dehydrogenase
MRHHSIRLESEALTEDFLATQDCVVIVTDHSAYDYEFIVKHAALVVDTRNATSKVGVSKDKIWRA